ncbi:hypothetical protein C476_01952 [Natrinema limicola JCM 13563]|uniref:Uncharacterized protein n=1 Tax=Natrinema limicola JCM 13563 TaxID=1230457 RepID=M0CTF7_9EURY|nr:hypothetical protein C476_01952 [Natrinema limicola JCM 13563]
MPDPTVDQKYDSSGTKYVARTPLMGGRTPTDVDRWPVTCFTSSNPIEQSATRPRDRFQFVVDIDCYGSYFGSVTAGVSGPPPV